MNLTALALEKRTLTHFLSLLLFVAGIAAFFELGRLEDPDFTVKKAVIITAYPGASAEEVELEVTDRIERAVQEMPQLDNIYSLSRPGLSIIRVEMKEQYWADVLPQVWDEMRKKIRDVSREFPPGVAKPDVGDDFSFVYGFVLAMTGDGYTYAELEEYAKAVRKEMYTVPGVSRVEFWGVQPKVIYLDVSEAQIAGLGITLEDLKLTLAQQNMIVDSGSVEVPGRRLRIETTGDFDTTEEIGDLVIRRSLLDVGYAATADADARSRALADSVPAVRGRGTDVLRLRDIADVRMGYLEPPLTKMRFNGEPAIAIQIANVAGGNIVATGEAIDAKLAQVLPELPIGIEVERFAWQSELVESSINGFVINLGESVLIVLVVLTIAMGWRMGIIIGTSLVMTIVGTIAFMSLLDIQLHRVSLGAFVIALGMMVDNAIVVADGISVRLAKGEGRKQAAIKSAQTPSIALLAATIIAIIAFFPVYAGKSDGQEYGRTLFVVIGVSLLLSWVLSMTVTPLHCLALIKPPKDGGSSGDEFDTPFFRLYRRVLTSAIRFRLLTVTAVTGLLAASIYGFGFVPTLFFPDSSRAQFMIDYWAPEGTPIQDVEAGLALLEEQIEGDPRVHSYASFIGAGGPRFYLPVDPEFPYASYGQLVINTNSFEDVDGLYREMEEWAEANVTSAMVRVRKYSVGPSDTWPFELRISGPAVADLATLRGIADEVGAILDASPYASHIRTDMRQRTQKLVVDYDSKRARWSIVPRAAVGESTKYAFDGQPVGLFRLEDDVLPIVARKTEIERRAAAEQLDQTQVWPVLGTQPIPLSQVTQGVYLEWEETIIARWNRRRQIAVQAAPSGVTFPTLREDVIDSINAIELPPGYELFWDGEYDSTNRATRALAPGIPPAVAIMLILLVAQFNSLRPMIVMFLVIPFAMIGITAVMLPLGIAFGFMALIGAMSLSGMMLKNSIVLIDEIRINKEAGMSPYDATVLAGVSRLRPVVLAATTTVLGVIPLLQDVFWVSMAATIMGGLSFGTLLTMVLVPVLYTMMYRIPRRGDREGSSPNPEH